MREEAEEVGAALRGCLGQKEPESLEELREALRRWATVTAAVSWVLTSIWLWFKVETPLKLSEHSHSKHNSLNHYSFRHPEEVKDERILLEPQSIHLSETDRRMSLTKVAYSTRSDPRSPLTDLEII